MANNEKHQNDSDEIDLKELFLSLWAYKLLIVTVTAIFVVVSGMYAVTADKIYTARSIFALGETGDSGGLSSLGGDRGALAGLVGVQSKDSGTDRVIERVTSRNFIIEVSSELGLQNDPLFNNYDPNSTEPVWKAIIKTMLGMQSVQQDPANLQDWNIVNSYEKLVTVEPTDTGAISISVKHEVPERAAEIANFLASKIISMVSEDNETDVDKKLQYLSRTLADASQELEAAQGALQQYSLKNSTQAIESFAIGSVLLDDVRLRRETAAEQLAAVLSVKVMLAEGSPTLEDYERLRQAFPLVDEASFRRIMGLSEVTSAWSWPSINTVTQVEASIRDRLASLDRDILKLSGDATRYAESAEELARLTRNLKVAEAAYTVLIEQVKSQSLVAGFRPENSKMLEVADVPIAASEPKRSLILALGLVLGVFVGAALALVVSSRSGVYLTLGALLDALGANHQHRVQGLKRFRGKDLSGVQKETLMASPEWGRQAVLEYASQDCKRPVFLCDTSTEDSADVLGRILAATAGGLGREAAFFDLSRSVGLSDKKLTTVVENKLACVSSAEGCSEYVYVSGQKNLDMMYSKSFTTILDQLLEKYQMVIFTANLDEINTVVSSSILERSFLMVRVRPGKTPVMSIKKLLKHGTVGVALHD